MSIMENDATLSLLAFDERSSKGCRTLRDLESGQVGLFQHDFIKIINSTAFGRLVDKTQIFVTSSRRKSTVRNRMQHTMTVVANTIYTAKRLGLNVELAAAIAIGHDIAHTVYGHLGENVVTMCTGVKFCHNIYGSILAQYFEPLNLSYETLSGIYAHSFKDVLAMPNDITPEGILVMYMDVIDWMAHDPDSLIEFRVADLKWFPNVFRINEWSAKDRTSHWTEELIRESLEKGRVSFLDCPEAKEFWSAKTLIYSDVYKKLDHRLHKQALIDIFEFLQKRLVGKDPVIAFDMMTDSEAMDLEQRMRNSYGKDIDLSEYSFTRLLPDLPDGQENWIDFRDPDLGWGDVPENARY